MKRWDFLGSLYAMYLSIEISDVTRVRDAKRRKLTRPLPNGRDSLESVLRF
jgi:hypothetical protein